MWYCEKGIIVTHHRWPSSVEIKIVAVWNLDELSCIFGWHKYSKYSFEEILTLNSFWRSWLVAKFKWDFRACHQSPSFFQMLSITCSLEKNLSLFLFCPSLWLVLLASPRCILRYVDYFIGSDHTIRPFFLYCADWILTRTSVRRIFPSREQQMN